MTFWHRKKNDKYSRNIKAITLEDAHTGTGGTTRVNIKIDGEIIETEIYTNRIFMIHE